MNEVIRQPAVSLAPVGWLLHGPSRVASSRLQGYRVHEFLRRSGLRSELVMAPPLVFPDVPWGPGLQEEIRRCLAGRIVVLQKLFGENSRLLVETCRGAGIPTVYVHCDFQPENRLPLECDAIVCTSEYLAERYREAGAARVYCVDDPAEHWCNRGSISGEAVRPGRLRLCWVGSRHNWHTLAGLREVLRRQELADLELVTVSDHPDADVPWSLEDVREVIGSCDIGVIPTVDGPAAHAKSSNRLVQFMALGRPVVAGVLPAYVRLLEHGRNGYLCRDAGEWVAALQALRSPAHRRDVALRAYDTVDPRFRMETVGDRWVEIFGEVAAHGTRASAPDAAGSSLARLRFHAALEFQRRAHELGDRGATAAALGSALAQVPRSPGQLPRLLRVQRQLFGPGLRRIPRRVINGALRRPGRSGRPDRPERNPRSGEMGGEAEPLYPGTFLRPRAHVQRRLDVLLARLREQADVGLHLGSGAHPIPGLINCDLHDPSADRRLDATDLYEFEDDSVDLVEHHHMIEHLSFEEAEKGIREWWRVLRPGGHLVVTCPDLEAVLRHWLRSDGEQRWGYGIRMIYGSQENQGMMHRSGYDRSRLTALLEAAGFDVRFTYTPYPARPTPSLLVIAIKTLRRPGAQ